MMASVKCAALIAFILTQCVSCEPVCSKFAYEEQLLEKMVRTEWKMERMQDDMMNFKNDMNTKVTAFGNRIESMVEAFNDFKGNIANDLENAKTVMKETEEINSKGGPANSVVAFSAHQLQDKSLSRGQYLIFTKTDFNDGDGYDVNTGVFTAPVGGWYLFSAHLCNRNGKEVAYALLNDGNAIVRSVQADKDYRSCSSVSVITKVDTGGNVRVQCLYTYGSTIEQFYEESSYRRLMFVGVLLHKI